MRAEVKRAIEGLSIACRALPKIDVDRAAEGLAQVRKAIRLTSVLAAQNYIATTISYDAEDADGQYGTSLLLEVIDKVWGRTTGHCIDPPSVWHLEIFQVQPWSCVKITAVHGWGDATGFGFSRQAPMDKWDALRGVRIATARAIRYYIDKYVNVEDVQDV